MGTRVVVIGPDKPIYNERTATEAITPGMLVDPVAAGTVEKNDITGLTRVEVAVENDIFGKGLDDDYASGDTVISQILTPGCEFMALVPAAGAAIAHDAFVTAVAGGFVGVGVQATAIGRARQAVDNSAGGTPARIRVVVI